MGLISALRHFISKLVNSILYFLTFRLVFWCSWLFLVLLSAVGLYSIFYWLTVPKPEHIRDVHLEHSKLCTRKTGDLLCSFPTGLVPLNSAEKYSSSQDGKVFALGQGYKIDIELDMPPSDVNKAAGMFSIELALIPKEGPEIKSLRSVMFPYRSSYFSFIKSLSFSGLYLLNLVEEKETITTTMFQNFRDDTFNRVKEAGVVIHARHVEIYAVRLRISANFQGIRYFMFYWPMTSASIGILAFLFLILLIWLWIYVKFTASSSGVQRRPVPNERFSGRYRFEGQGRNARYKTVRRSSSVTEAKVKGLGSLRKEKSTNDLPKPSHENDGPGSVEDRIQSALSSARSLRVIKRPTGGDSKASSPVKPPSVLLSSEGNALPRQVSDVDFVGVGSHCQFDDHNKQD